MTEEYSIQFDQYLEFRTDNALINDLTLVVLDGLAMDRVNRNAYKVTIGKILVNLFVAWKNNKDKVVGFSRNKTFWYAKNPMDNRFYNNPSLGFATVTKSLDVLVAKKWVIKTTEGFYYKEEKHGRTTRYKASKKLCDAFVEHGLTLAMVRREDSKKSVILRSKKPKKTPKNLRPRGKNIGYKSNKKIIQMEKNLEVINWALEKAHIDLFITRDEEKQINRRLTKKAQREEGNIREIQYQDKSLQRIFNVDFEHGGRFYGGFWQQIPSEYRDRLTIHNHLTGEIDYSQIHPTILYNKIGQPMVDELHRPIDPYSFDDENRKSNKKVFNTMLNSKNFKECEWACSHNDGFVLPKKYKTWEDFLNHIQTFHKPISDYFFTGYGLKLQRLDSDICETVLMEMFSVGKIVLPVHDSFVTTWDNYLALGQCMNKASLKHLGFHLWSKPEVKIFNDVPVKLDPTTITTNTDYFKRREEFYRAIDIEDPHGDTEIDEYGFGDLDGYH